MQFESLIEAILIKRYKRFLADVELVSGEKLTVHCPNTGAMTGCAEPGSTVWLSTSNNTKRKYPHTWELVQTPLGDMASIHSAKANTLVREAIECGVIEALQGYDEIKSEVKYGSENSRVDFLLANDSEQCFVEVKSVTLLGENNFGFFPDAKSDRGTKHLRELIAIKQQGYRAVLFFCVQHTGINSVSPADRIDKVYAQTFREALDSGVEVMAYKTRISPESIKLVEAVPVFSRQF